MMAAAVRPYLGLDFVTFLDYNCNIKRLQIMDIAKIFKSKARKALFRLFFTNPEGRYYLRELERLLGIPVSMIRKELLRLKKEGVFLSEKRGNLTFYYLSKSYPLFDEFKSIVFKTIGAAGLLREVLERIKGIEVAFIYGSFAKDETNAESDIDLFVIGKIDEDELIKKISKIEKNLKRDINYSIYAKADFEKKKKEKDSFITDLIENPKVFLIGDKDEL
ncbi:MAG: nucleotidyltransferase domain-containing protein [Candidatus Omnitrophota bacterium]